MTKFQKIRNWVAAMVFVAGAGGATLAVALPQTTHAAGCSTTLLTFPAWYRGLLDAKCDVQSPSTIGIGAFIWTIILNVIEVMLQLVGYIAVGFVIAGGFKYMTSAGAPDGMTKAKNTILNALIGLAISMASVGIINVVAGAIR